MKKIHQLPKPESAIEINVTAGMTAKDVIAILKCVDDEAAINETICLTFVK